eukprot:1142688-Pelagomonas_calceolata.AAC.4
MQSYRQSAPSEEAYLAKGEKRGVQPSHKPCVRKFSAVPFHLDMPAESFVASHAGEDMQL